VRDVAVDLGISDQTVYSWRRQERMDQGIEPGLTSAERAELAAARRRIRELETELAIHRKAAALVTNALGMAIDQRRPHGDTVIHSDQGQFTSWAFTRRAVESGLLPSMGSVGDCYDNAMMESFWSRVQVELLDRKRWSTRIELADAIFEHLEIFHNRQRRHSSLSMLTRLEFEARHQPTTAA
jgi:transposase InsO family protein